VRKVTSVVRRFIGGRAEGSLDRGSGPSAIVLPSLRARVPEIDGLRGVAILLVIAFHYLEPVHRPAEGWLRNALAPARMGWIGVNLFFVLSGYLIGSILMANRHSPTYFSAFYIRRFCRILPLYLVVVIGCYAVHHLFVRTPGPPLYQYLTFTQNFWMAAKGHFGIGLLAITWSLAVEEQFYALLPPLVRFNPSKRLLVLVVGCLLLAPVLRYFFIGEAGRDGIFAAQVLLFTHLDALMLGVLFAWMRARDFVIPRRIVRIVWIISAALTTMSALHTPTPAPVSPLLATFFHEVIIVMCGATLLIALEGGLPFLRWKALTYTGLISYGLYLMHHPLNWAMHAAFRWNDAKDVRLAAVSFAVVYLIAAVSWEWFEKPFVRFGHHFRYEDDQGAAFAAPENSPKQS
jgi:peptidoglycan/LPS O-acetylase OafA/YrhL